MASTTIKKNIINEEFDSGSKVSPIGHFKCRETIPLPPKSTEDEYPFLCSNRKNVYSEKKKCDSSYKKPNTTSFIVASSYISEKQNKYAKESINKEFIKNTLVRTRACNNVCRESIDSEYGVCYRMKCDFAHSMLELNDPTCSFDNRCRFFYGKPRSDGSIDHVAMCKFRHSNENREEWIKRTGRVLPDLPENSDETHKPTESKTSNIQEVPVTPVKIKSRVQIPDAPIKKMNTVGLGSNRWDDLKIRSMNIKCDSTASSNNNNNTNRTISVQTVELAEIAIKAAMDRGIFGLRVIVE
jgi:hypothetical protein